MKKKMKSVIALVLACVMMFCAFPAFAAEADETVRWYYSENYTEYTYAGELKEGKNSVEAYDSDIIYCNFKAEKAGYYLFFNENSYVDEDVFTGIENGRVKDVREDGEWIGFLGDYGGSGNFYYLEPGEVFIGFYLVGGTGFPVSLDFGEITVTYCGEVTGMTFKEGDFDVLQSDLWWQEYYYQDNFDEIKSGYRFPYGLSIDNVKVSFSSGETVEMGKSCSYIVLTESTIGDNSFGTYNAKIRFLNYEEDIRLNVYLISDYIEDAELCNAEKYATVKEYYNGDIRYDNDVTNGETIVVTFVDGTKKNVVIDEHGKAEITLPNGRTYYLYTYFGKMQEECNSSDYYLFIALDYSRYRVNSYECEIVKADNDENYEHLVEVTIGDYVDALVYYLELASNADSVMECVNSISAFWAVFKECIKNRSDLIFEEFVIYFYSLI